MPDQAPATNQKKPKTKSEIAQDLIRKGKAMQRQIAQDEAKQKRRDATRSQIIIGALSITNPTKTLPELILIASERDRQFLYSVGVGVSNGVRYVGQGVLADMAGRKV